VLDSFAVLAYLEGETGMSRVRSVLEGAEAKRHIVYLSLINLGEVLYITERERGLVAARRALGAVEQLPLEIVGVSRRRCWPRLTSRPAFRSRTRMPSPL